MSSKWAAVMRCCLPCVKPARMWRFLILKLARRRPGVEAAAELARSGLTSQTGAPVRSLILTTFRRPGYLRRALEAGASGFVVKDGTASQLAQAVRRTAAGLRVVDSVLAEEAKWQGSSPLTGRETRGSSRRRDCR